MEKAPIRLTRKLFPVLGILVAGLIVAAAIWMILGVDWNIREVKIASGEEGQAYFKLGQGLAKILEENLPRSQVQCNETQGSKENVQLIERGEVTLGFIQNDMRGSTMLRSVAALYQEILHIVVRADQNPSIRELEDLKGKKIAVGSEGGGTAETSLKVLHHFDLKDEDVELVYIKQLEAVDSFHNGEVDAVFVLSAIPCDVVDRLLEKGTGKLLSLGSPEKIGSELDGLHLAFPYLSNAVVPSHTYGHVPSDPIGTIGVEAVLATRFDADPDLIRQITSILYANKVKLSDYHAVGAGLSEEVDTSNLRFPLHEGADSYYRRDTPPFFVEYAEAMSFCLSIMIAVGAGVLAVKRWVKQTKKDRIDKYYLEIDRITQGLEEAADDVAFKIRSDLIGLRRKAFQDLVAEKISADESFTIFQDYLNSELEEIHERVHFK